MKRSLFGKGILMIVLFTLISAVGICAEDPVTLVGKIIDDYQLITSEGAVYEIGNTEAGAEMLDTIQDETEEISITGVLHKDGETMVINVISYKVVKE